MLLFLNIKGLSYKLAKKKFQKKISKTALFSLTKNQLSGGNFLFSPLPKLFCCSDSDSVIYIV